MLLKSPVQRWKRNSRGTERGSLECRLLKVFLFRHLPVCELMNNSEGYPKQIRMAHLAVIGNILATFCRGLIERPQQVVERSMV